MEVLSNKVSAAKMLYKALSNVSVLIINILFVPVTP